MQGEEAAEISPDAPVTNDREPEKAAGKMKPNYFFQSFSFSKKKTKEPRWDHRRSDSRPIGTGFAPRFGRPKTVEALEGSRVDSAAVIWLMLFFFFF